MLDVTLLRVLKYREHYEKMFRVLPSTGLDEKTTTLLKDYGRYFDDFPEHTKIDERAFASVFFNFYHKGLKDDTKGYYAKMIMSMVTYGDDQTKSTRIDKLGEVNYVMQAAQLIEDYQDGKEVDLIHGMSEITTKAVAQRERRIRIPWVNDSINDILVEDEQDGGLHWRLPILNSSMRPLRAGDFGVIAGRPDTGKTSFLTGELSYMAGQFDEIYPDEDRYVLWFNNEGPGRRIVSRFYQSAIGVNTPKLVEYKQDGSIVNRYVKEVGTVDRIRVIDIHDMWSYDIIDIIEEMKPGLIIFDMIDNIKFAGDLGSGSRTDQVLEAQYQWARLLGVKYDCPVLATSQISNEGDGELYPTLGMLKDSKTGKQGACDFQLMIGKSNNPSMEDVRGIGLVKNKLHRFGNPKDPRCMVNFNAPIGRYEMCEME